MKTREPIEIESWPEVLPSSAIEMLQWIFRDNVNKSRQDVPVILSPERTAHALNKYNQLRMILKINGAIRLPLVGKLLLRGKE